MAPVAVAKATSGGLTPPEPPVVKRVICGTDGGYGCFKKNSVQPGGAITVKGSSFTVGAQVTFLGSSRPGDDVTAPAELISPEELQVPVPDGARSGRVSITNADGQSSNISRKRIRIRKLHNKAGGPGPIVQAVRTSPRRFYLGAERLAALTYQVQGGDTANVWVQVDLFRLSDGVTVRSWTMENVPTGRPVYVTWDGTDSQGNILEEGQYAFRLVVRDPQGRETTKVSARTATIKKRSRNMDRSRRRAHKRTHVAPGTILFIKFRFPINGRYDLNGFGSGGRFGAGRGGRSHQGIDIESPCGTPLVAVGQGTVKWKASHAAAGYYVVISVPYAQADFVYMHMLNPALVEKGDQVSTGQTIGFVGETGNARGCHLHWEMWQGGGGWYDGGKPVDPLPFAKQLAKNG